MKKFIALAVGLSLCLSLLAQKATEIYIPIGKSPGLSEQKLTVIGRIEAAGKDIIIVKGVNVKFDDKTKIYLDKSKVKVPNEYGNSEALKLKSFVEVKFFDNDRKKRAEWIKVESL